LPLRKRRRTKFVEGVVGRSLYDGLWHRSTLPIDAESADSTSRNLEPNTHIRICGYQDRTTDQSPRDERGTLVAIDVGGLTSRGASFACP
jgi:hypothetical protein